MLENPYHIFLIDALGALISAIFLGLILITIQPLIGLSSFHLYILSSIAIGLALFSFSCYIIKPTGWKVNLSIIIFLNMAYSLFTVAIMVFFYKTIQPLGYLYFILELLVLIAVVIFEWKVLKGK